jgi:hypothetical protein
MSPAPRPGLCGPAGEVGYALPAEASRAARNRTAATLPAQPTAQVGWVPDQPR